MGVHGLWKLIDKAGRPVPVESLENKVLAIDVSIWLYQLVRGFDSSARPGSNMFLLGFFHRICKLLFYRIKPIFVFDGGVPSLKKKTIAARQKGRRRAQESIEKVRQQLLENLIQQQALGDVLGENVKIPKQFTSKQDELFWLPPTSEEAAISRLEEESDSEDEQLTQKYIGDLNSVDVSSEEFLQLPADVRHDILTDLKETRKLNSWARIHLMPEEAGDFSSFQMGRLLKRRAVQVGLDKATEELGVRGFTVTDLENILTEQGIDLSQRIAADSSTRFFYTSNPLGKQNEQNQQSGDEDDVSKHICSSRNFSSSESSGSEGEIAPVVQKMASRGNGGLSQQEILDLIKQQHIKASEKCGFESGRPGTSKSDLSFPEEEESKSPTEMGTRGRINDPTVARGKASNGDNEISKLGPGKFSGANTLSGKTTTSQKDIPLWSNQVGGVSPCKNVPGISNEALEQKNDPGFNEGMERAIDENTELTSNRFDIFMSSNETNSSTKFKKGLDSTIEPEQSIEHGSAHFTEELVGKSLESSVKEAVAKSILMLTGTPQSESDVSKGNNSISKKSLEIVISPNKIIEDDAIFADIFSVPLPSKPKSTSTDSTSPKSQIFSKSLEIVIDPNETPEEDIFAEVFSDCDKSESATHQSTSSKSRTSPNALEIVIDPKEPPEEDIFADIFSRPADSSQVDEPFTAAKSIESLDFVDPDAPTDDDLSTVFTANFESNSQETIKPSFRKLVNKIKKSSSTKDLNDIKNILEKESQQLAGETKREERLASTITEQITQEAKNLLELFGIPYVVAPMEAEAQCAYLDLTGQTEGTITDDSDIWLFGANNVFKNFFDQKKFVKLYKSSDIHQCYRLNRDDLIMIAMLVGSDYTSGLAGIGPVNAIEIIAHFPRSQGAPTPQSRLLKFVDAYISSEMNQRLLKKLTSIEFTDGFPSDEVVKAYMSPIVDESKEKFSWSKPDLAKIKHFMRDKFGWDFNKTDKTLIPIFDKLNQSSTQKTIHNYFDWAFDEGEAATVSRRVGNAVEILATGIIPSPTKKPRKDELSNRRTKPKDRLVSNYSRRKYGRYQQQEMEMENEPVLEGMRTARAAAKAIMAATRKPNAKALKSQAVEVAGVLASNIMPNPKRNIGETTESPQRKKAILKKLKTPDPVDGPSSSCAAPANVPLPALSDILCGVGTEPPVPQVHTLWTPSKDLVSPYAKRKYGKLGQSTTNGRDSFVVPQRPIQSFDHVMPSKTPAQIARERAAKKLKESKQKTAQRKIRKSTSN